MDASLREIIGILIAFWLALNIASCGSHKEKDSYAEKLDLLRAKRGVYLNLAKQVEDQDSWLLTDECDALLHTSLYNFGGAVVNIYRAQDEDGRWWRRPSRDCLSSGSSKSSISRDMILGALYVLWMHKNLDALERTLSYLSEAGSFGEHDGSLDGRNRVTSTPTFLALMYELRYSLGGSYSSYQEIPQTYFPVSGFAAHLQALNIQLLGMTKRSISTIQRNTLASQAEKDPNNELFLALFHAYEDGHQERAVDILLREDLFPSDKLPSSNERCAPYLWMHGEKDEDWLPCPSEEKTHPGHDLLFVSAIILGREENLGGDTNGNSEAFSDDRFPLVYDSKELDEDRRTQGSARLDGDRYRRY